jgi:hypothetical protein|tara:strand:+ start:2627 stop:3577 length:951 start_codon:yes stop_codon:yes gene_type:complete
VKGLRIAKLQSGGYLSALEKSRPELFKTISNYRSRLTSPEQQIFDKRADIQYKATMNMPTNQRDAYIASIEKQFAEPTDKQFSEIQEGLKSKTFTPTYQYAAFDESKPASTTGYYRDLTPEIEKAEKDLEELIFTKKEEKTRPQYEVTYPRASVYGSQRPSEMTTDLPKGAVLTRGAYGREYLQEPIKNRTSMGQVNLNPQYRQVGSQKYIETTTRPARAGDPEYDRQAAALERLKTRHKFRFMYGNQSPTALNPSNVYGQLGMGNVQKQQTMYPSNVYGTFGMKKGSEVKVKKQKNEKMRGTRAAIRGTTFRGVF